MKRKIITASVMMVVGDTMVLASVGGVFVVSSTDWVVGVSVNVYPVVSISAVVLVGGKGVLWEGSGDSIVGLLLLKEDEMGNVVGGLRVETVDFRSVLDGAIPPEHIRGEPTRYDRKTLSTPSIGLRPTWI